VVHMVQPKKNEDNVVQIGQERAWSPYMLLLQNSLQNIQTVGNLTRVMNNAQEPMDTYMIDEYIHNAWWVVTLDDIWIIDNQDLRNQLLQMTEWTKYSNNVVELLQGIDQIQLLLERNNHEEW
jgi:hypothetical protein